MTGSQRVKVYFFLTKTNKLCHFFKTLGGELMKGLQTQLIYITSLVKLVARQQSLSYHLRHSCWYLQLFSIVSLTKYEGKQNINKYILIGE